MGEESTFELILEEFLSKFRNAKEGFEELREVLFDFCFLCFHVFLVLLEHLFDLRDRFLDGR